MSTPVELELQEINRKLDFLIEHAERMERRVSALEDLKSDLMPIVNEIMKAAMENLEEVAPELTLERILSLLKKLAVNLGTIEQLIDRAVAANELITDMQPILNDITITVMEKLDEYERKGYVDFIRTMANALDRVVTGFTREEVEAFSDNVVLILNTVKSVTQPELMTMVNQVVSVTRKIEYDEIRNPSVLSLVKDLSSPEIRRGLAFFLRVLKEASHQPALPPAGGKLN
ncbi:MAG: DUF1641 domain-containing protein [Bacteroidetes bacterium]|nr:DUF1641 domain-containing protein [Bacteroidota bacterium]